MSYSLYVKHHVGNGLLFVLLAVVEENLLAAHDNILQQQNRHGEVMLMKERLAYIIKAASFIYTFFSHPNFLVLFLTGRESQPSSLISEWEKEIFIYYILYHFFWQVALFFGKLDLFSELLPVYASSVSNSGPLLTLAESID